MAHYLIQASYTPEAVAKLVRNPQDRLSAVAPVLERLGGRLVSKWMALGEFDVVAIVELPDPVSVTAFSMAVLAGGALRACKTTPLLTPEESVASMRKASQAGYQPPAG